MVFGIMQQQQALYSTHIQMPHKNFDADTQILMSITPEKLEQAQEEEVKNVPISDPVVWLLHQHIHAMGGHVMASDQARYQL